MNILLICSLGMSTSIVVKKMRQVANEEDKIDAVSITELDKNINDYDVFLIGPQMGFRLKEVQKKCEEIGNKTAAKIDMMAYGLGDGAKVYKQAQELYATLDLKKD